MITEKDRPGTDSFSTISAHTSTAALAGDAIELVKTYDGLGYARERLDAELELAVDSLALLPESDARSCLEKLAGLMAVRTV